MPQKKRVLEADEDNDNDNDNNSNSNSKATEQPLLKLVKKSATHGNNNNADLSFSVEIFNSHIFRNLVESVTAIVPEATFNIISEQLHKKKWSGIAVNEADTANVCDVTARMICDEVYINKNRSADNTNVSFRVNTELFRTLIAGMRSGNSLKIFQKQNSDDVHLLGFDSNSHNHTYAVSMPTLVQDRPSRVLPRMKYHHMIDLKVNMLRSILKTAQNNKVDAKNLRFTIYETVLDDNKKLSVTEVSFDAGVAGPKVSHRFNAITEVTTDADGNIEVNHCDDEIPDDIEVTEENKIFTACYNLKRIHDIIKPMDAETIVIRFHNGPQVKVMQIQYPLGGGLEAGVCSFVLMPLSENDEIFDDDAPTNDAADEKTNKES